MLSLILSTITDYQGPEIIIYISVALECLLSVIGLLCYFFPENSKFGAILRKIFKGAKKVQDKIDDITDNNNDAEDNKNE